MNHPELEYIEGTTIVVEKEQKDCAHNNRSYAPYILTSYPPQQKWICRDCGFEGIEIRQPINNDYQEIIEKFQSQNSKQSSLG